MINVVIADDHPLIREGIKKVLNSEVEIKLLDEASNGRELLAILADCLPDILILDVTMPGQSGLEMLKDLQQAYPQIPVLILSIHPVERFAVRALKAGASGYLCKTSISNELIKAIVRIVIHKRRYISSEVAEQLALQIDNSGRPLHESLSDREFEVMCKIAVGKDVNQIAGELSLSPHTVHTYRSRIKEKMNLATNVEMTRYAIENELIN